MKKYIILFLVYIPIFFYIQSLNAVPEDTNETIQYSPADYDPGIPVEWIREDGTFGE